MSIIFFNGFYLQPIVNHEERRLKSSENTTDSQKSQKNISNKTKATNQ